MGARKVLFVPVWSPELKQFAYQWQKDRTADPQTEQSKAFADLIAIYDHGQAKSKRREAGLGRLKRVDSADHLYILAHGISGNVGGAHFIGDSAVGKRYSAEHLADILVMEGLSRLIAHITVYACVAGLAPDAHTLPFAEQLKNSLRLRRFPLVEVSGYTVPVCPGYAIFPATSQRPEATEKQVNFARHPVTGPVPAREHKVHFPPRQ